MKILKIIDYVFEIHWEKNTAQENNVVDLSFDFFFFVFFLVCLVGTFIWFVVVLGFVGFFVLFFFSLVELKLC